MLTGIRSQIVGPAAVVASNGTGRVVPTAVSVEPRGELAGGQGETGPSRNLGEQWSPGYSRVVRTGSPDPGGRRAGGSSGAHPATNRRPQGEG